MPQYGTSTIHWLHEWRGLICTIPASGCSKNIDIRLTFQIKSKDILSSSINFYHLGIFQKTLFFLFPMFPPTLSHSAHMPATSQGSNPNSTFEASALHGVIGTGENDYVYIYIYYIIYIVTLCIYIYYITEQYMSIQYYIYIYQNTLYTIYHISYNILYIHYIYYNTYILIHIYI